MYTASLSSLPDFDKLKPSQGGITRSLMIGHLFIGYLVSVPRLINNIRSEGGVVCRGGPLPKASVYMPAASDEETIETKESSLILGMVKVKSYVPTTTRG